MTVVQNTATDPGGDPLVSINVRISLVTGSPNTPGYTASGEIAGTFTVPTDTAGHWSATLTPNSSITPANSYYQVVEGQAISNIVVPATGGPYLLGDLLVTPPPTGTPLGITGVQVAGNGTIAGVRPEINLIAGAGMTVTATDNAGAGRVDVTLASSGGGGAVASVNGHTGTVVLGAADVSAIPTSAEGAASGVATLDGSGHLTAAQAVNLLAAANNLSDLANATAARTNLGLGNAATGNIGTTTGTIAAGDDSRITGAAQKSANLSDLASASTARANLGLGSAATQASSAFDAAGAATTAQTNAIAAAESNAAATYVPLSSLPLPLASGGTGQATQSAALTALAGTQSAGRYLRSDGTNTALAAIQAADVPTLNQSTTGTAAGLSATLAVGSGGTGQATAQAAINALTGAQSAGKYLRSDGVNATLATIQAGDVPTLNQSTTGTAANVTGNVAIANGGTGQATQQAAVNALTGTQVAGRYLRSDGTNATLAAIQAADVPTLNQSTTGNAAGLSATLAVASGGTGQTSAQAALDALAGGTTSGNYLRGNGTHVALSTIQAADLPAATTGVQGAVVIDGTAADFQPSGIASAGTVGKVADAGHIHPGPAHQFSVLAYGAKGDGKISNTGASTAASTTVTIGESVLTSGDVGKVVMVKNALNVNNASGQTTSVGTITAVNSATSFTATWNTTPTQTTTGLQVLWATDDTTAIQSAIAAANTYALAHNSFAEIYFPVGAGLYYGVGGALKSTDGTNAVYNSQLTIPVNAETNPGVTLTFRGVGGGGNPRYWNSDSPQFGGGIQSFGCFTSSGTQSTSITGGGNPSVIGGPTGKFGYGVVVTGTTPTFSNTCVEFRNLTIRTTHSNSGWTFSAANMFGVARFHAYDFTCGTNGTVQFYKYTPNLGDFTNVTLLSGGLSIGVIMPSNGNNASNYLQNFVIDGGYTFGLFATEHTVGNSVTVLYCWGGLCPVGNYNDSGSGAASALHAIAIDQACVEGCTYAIDVVGAGQSGIGPIVHVVLDTEGTVQLRDAIGGTLANTGAGLAAALGTIRLVGSPSAITISTGTGAGGLGTGLQITKEQNLPGVPSSGIPALVDGTAVSNTLWRPATVYLSGGTNVTTVAVSRLAGGVNTVAVSTVISQAAGPIAANTPIRLGPGQWIKVTTSAGTLPTAVWVLD